MHESGKRFPGYSLGAYVDRIAALIEQHEPDRLLDYGCGKGYQYLARRYHERWPGQLLPHCYDIGVPQLSTKPEGQFGGVICTDMLEHVEKPDLQGIIDELIGYTTPGGFLLVGISCRPTRKRLPGTDLDVHRTIEPPSWWTELLLSRLRREQGVTIYAEFEMGNPPHFPAEVERLSAELSH